jgi:hypothetical protein
MEIFAKLEQQVRQQGAELRSSGRRHHRLRQGHSQGRDRRRRGHGGNGRPHRRRGLHFYKDIDVICDVGGQDIKIIILRERAREGLQTEHPVLGRQRLLPAIHGAGLRRSGGAVRRRGLQRQGLPAIRLRLRRLYAVRHRRLPAPGLEARGDHGRAVQRAAQEHLAVRFADPNLAAIGRRFLLQGGTQYNLAAVKAQVDFIESRFKGKDVQTGSDRARALRRSRGHRRGPGSRAPLRPRPQTTFIGLDAVGRSATRPRATKLPAVTSARTSACARSSTSRPISATLSPSRPKNSKVPLEEGSQRVIIATCEKGTVEDVERDARHQGQPRSRSRPIRISPKSRPRRCSGFPTHRWWPIRLPRLQLTPGQKKRAALMKKRESFASASRAS